MNETQKVLKKFDYRDIDSKDVVPRSGHRSVIIGDILYIIGGFNPKIPIQIIDEIKRFSLTQNRWLESKTSTGVPSKSMASHVAASYGRFIIIHGGSELPFGTVKRRSLYAYDTQTAEWFPLDKNLSDENSLPRGIYGHTLNIVNGVAYIIGGTSGNLYFNSVYSLDLEAPSLKWVTLYEQDVELMHMDDDEHESAPSGRYRHETAVIGNYLVMIGGGEQTKVFDINKIYFFNMTTCKWTKNLISPEKPHPLNRKCHSINQVGFNVYVIGGQSIETSPGRAVIRTLDDVWRLNLNPENVSESNFKPERTKLSWEKVGKTDIPIHFHSSAYDQKSESIYVFGGNTFHNVTNEPIRTNQLSSMQLAPSSLKYLSKATAFKVYDNNLFIRDQLEYRNVFSPSPA